jgi:hypothetical protein
MLKKEMKEHLTKRRRLLKFNPYTEEDFKILSDILHESKDDKAFLLWKQFVAFDYMPVLIESWALSRCEEYDYYGILFGPLENIALILNEELDVVERIILNWRYDRSK